MILAATFILVALSNLISSEKIALTNARFAASDPDAPNREGTIIASWDEDYDVGNAIDGNINTAAHPKQYDYNAHFFVDLTQSSVVDVVKIWPRIGGQGGTERWY